MIVCVWGGACIGSKISNEFLFFPVSKWEKGKGRKLIKRETEGEIKGKR